ncbi:putative transposase-like protein [Portunus trituberculatus]|uniref:Putative transposase-like protein n=1 Tax=Portunus trituberculatus TaxID=210409 RepID=A0A5B7JD55_PORTR|nr:putative transposase-like protein [Portunus trituberculatus]
MVGTVDRPGQIDETYFGGRRKYDRGRFLQGDNAAEEEDSDPVQNNRNHGRRIDGRWVFGLKNGMDVIRLSVVEKRDGATLEPIIKRKVAPGSVIHSDEWPAYRPFNAAGFVHSTVNHQQNYEDPNTGVHTQNIERVWLDTNTKIMNTTRGTPRHLLQAHLNEYSWRIFRLDADDLFMVFLIDLRSVFR